MLSMDEILEKGGLNFEHSRLKEAIYQFGLASQAVSVSVAYAAGHKHFDPFGSPTWHAPKHIPRGIALPQGDFLKHASQGGDYPIVWAVFSDDPEPPGPDAQTISTAGLSHLDFVNISLQFMRFHETHRHQIGAAFKFNWSKIPEVWRFAAVLRNAIAHAGCITIDDPNFTPVEWEGLRYDHSSNGRALEMDLAPTDILFLLIQMETVLWDYDVGPVEPLEAPLVQIPEHFAQKLRLGRKPPQND